MARTQQQVYLLLIPSHLSKPSRERHFIYPNNQTQHQMDESMADEVVIPTVPIQCKGSLRQSLNPDFVQPPFVQPKPICLHSQPYPINQALSSSKVGTRQRQFAENMEKINEQIQTINKNV